jgi:hypothetical protein
MLTLRFSRPPARSSRRTCLALEPLEDRAVPSTVTWIGRDGDWSVGANWSTGSVPGPADDVVIDQPRVTVTHSSGRDAVHSLMNVSSALVVTGGTLFVSATIQIDGTLTLNGGSFDVQYKTLDGTGTVVNLPGPVWNLTHSTINTTLMNYGAIDARNAVDLRAPFTNEADATTRVIGDVGGTDTPTLQVASGFSNDGLIDLTSTGAAYASTLAIPNGTLVNEGDGMILAEAGSGGQRTLQVNILANRGTLRVEASTNLLLTGKLDSSDPSTLDGGTYSVAGIFEVPTLVVLTNNAGIVLDGAGQIRNDRRENALMRLGANTAQGSLQLLDGALLQVEHFSNAGQVEIDDTSVFGVNADYIQTDGNTFLNDGTLHVGGLADIQSGVVSGTGTLDGTVQNAGTLIAGSVGQPGVLTITGDLIETAGGILYFEISGPNAGTDYSQLAVFGGVSLDGSLTVFVTSGYQPPSGTPFQLLSAGNGVSGTFATLDGDASLFTVVYNPGDVTLIA